MRITKTDRMTANFEYHNPESNEQVKAVAYIHGAGIRIVSGDVEYSLFPDGQGGLTLRACGRAFEGMRISPRSRSEMIISAEMWEASK